MTNSELGTESDRTRKLRNPTPDAIEKRGGICLVKRKTKWAKPVIREIKAKATRSGAYIPKKYEAKNKYPES